MNARPRRRRRPIDTAMARRVAVMADCDPRSVDRVMRGEMVRPMTARRIREALAELGLPAPPTAATSPAA
jgi:DNA-binding LacI/PurR family transcriptional regulator